MNKEEALKILHNFRLMIAEECELREALDMAIESLKDRPQGKWIERHEIIKQLTIFGENRCSNCGKISLIKGDFCPNCGADMRGDAE